jgi:hypothetical protein
VCSGAFAATPCALGIATICWAVPSHLLLRWRAPMNSTFANDTARGPGYPSMTEVFCDRAGKPGEPLWTARRTPPEASGIEMTEAAHKFFFRGAS